MAHYDATARMLEVAPASEPALYLAAGSALAINHPRGAAAHARQTDVARSGTLCGRRGSLPHRAATPRLWRCRTLHSPGERP
jgi:hypothetical protein